MGSAEFMMLPLLAIMNTFLSVVADTSLAIGCVSQHQGITECYPADHDTTPIKITGVKLLREYVTRSCVYGTYGYFEDYLWVNKGCSGEFWITYSPAIPTPKKDYPIVEKPENIHAMASSNGVVKSIGCRSVHGGLSKCFPIGNPDLIATSVSITAARSPVTCIIGTTFGAKDDYVWVNGGCSGDFAVNFIPVTTKTVTCKSTVDSYQTCRVGGKIVKGKIMKEFLLEHCHQKYDYDFAADYVWVRNNCQATFAVQIVK